MSKPPIMVDCPACHGKTTVLHFIPNKNKIAIEDICPRCGGSGRIVL